MHVTHAWVSISTSHKHRVICLPRLLLVDIWVHSITFIGPEIKQIRVSDLASKPSATDLHPQSFHEQHTCVSLMNSCILCFQVCSCEQNCCTIWQLNHIYLSFIDKHRLIIFLYVCWPLPYTVLYWIVCHFYWFVEDLSFIPCNW